MSFRIRTNRPKASLISVFALACAPILAMAASVNSVTVNQQNGLDNATITLEGSGFGEKNQAPPVLWVFGSDVRQNGQSLDFTGYQIGASVATTGPKIWEFVDERVIFSDQTRYAGLGHSYFVGNNGTVRFPLAFGGTNPPYSDKIYASARIKPVEAWHDFKSIGVANITGAFDVGPSRYELGEAITVVNEFGTKQTQGRIVYFDPEFRLVTLKTEANWGKSDLANANVVGNSSGSKMTLSASTYYSFAIGSKYFRMWSGGSKPGLFNTMATNRMITGYRDSSGNVVAEPKDQFGNFDAGYGIPDVTARLDWRLIETYIDQSTDIIETYVDVDNISRRYLKNIDISSTEKFLDRSPTLSQLGLDAAGGAETIDAALYFGEIYFDTSPKRVMLSDKETYAEAGTELEIQYVLSWTDESLTFEFRPGALSTNSVLYAYIFDDNSVPNQNGLPICVNCELKAPNPVEVFIE